ncbi:hypothetical protein [Campylobacter sp. RM16192]|nr:hypothetical protein [Campylobacter sp. RM16192]
MAKSISNSLFVKKPVKHHPALIDKDRIRDFIKALNETEEGTDFNVCYS